jgi:hypothetical protein
MFQRRCRVQGVGQLQAVAKRERFHQHGGARRDRWSKRQDCARRIARLFCAATISALLRTPCTSSIYLSSSMVELLSDFLKF